MPLCFVANPPDQVCFSDLPGKAISRTANDLGSKVSLFPLVELILMSLLERVIVATHVLVHMFQPSGKQISWTLPYVFPPSPLLLQTIINVLLVIIVSGKIQMWILVLLEGEENPILQLINLEIRKVDM